MTPAKKVKSSNPIQQTSDVGNPSVLQWTIIVTLPPSKTDVLEFFTKILAKRSTHTITFFALNAQYLPVYNKTDREANTC